MTYIGIIIMMFFIVVFYFAALLVFTPYEEDDKYILKIVAFGYRLHEKAIKNGGFLKKITDSGAKIILVLVYFILKDRKYTESIDTSEQDENTN
ncbi:MAG: hypothetical protein KAH04_05740 [Psychrilyobacter sp.]|nr:hypothetical protein [Psychrilyobacter sp.]